MSDNPQKSDLQWKEDNLPVSIRFDDLYYSKEDGRAETRHVFIDGNNLRARWLESDQFIIAELGFGTGLNFLETAYQWQSITHGDKTLTYISFEQFPITAEEMAMALSRWPELKTLAGQLTGIWQTEVDILTIEFLPGIKLEVRFGDANQLLPALGFEADAWYLDGFSPAKNPELWNPSLMQEVGQRTAENGTFATYTSAGFVKRGLHAAGFKIEKVAGFGRKREMLTGTKLRDIDVAERH